MTTSTTPFRRATSLSRSGTILGVLIAIGTIAAMAAPADQFGRKEIWKAQERLKNIDPDEFGTPEVEPNLGRVVMVEVDFGEVTILVNGSIEVLLSPGVMRVFTSGSEVRLPGTVATAKILGLVTTTFAVTLDTEVIKYVDLDNDGTPDEGYIDTDGDGDADFFFTNFGSNTRPDGSPDWDSASYDSDNDGFYDTVWTDNNNNGKVEANEVGPDLPPPGTPVLPMNC